MSGAPLFTVVSCSSPFKSPSSVGEARARDSPPMYVKCIEESVLNTAEDHASRPFILVVLEGVKWP